MKARLRARLHDKWFSENKCAVGKDRPNESDLKFLWTHCFPNASRGALFFSFFFSFILGDILSCRVEITTTSSSRKYRVWFRRRCLYHGGCRERSHGRQHTQASLPVHILLFNVFISPYITVCLSYFVPLLHVVFLLVPLRRFVLRIVPSPGV